MGVIVSKRQFSVQKYWEDWAVGHVPALSCKASDAAGFAAWKAEALPKLDELLGAFPAKVPLATDVDYVVEDGDIIRERVVFDSEANMSVPCHVLYAKSMKKDGTNAAIVCSHGHGPHGNDSVAGIVGDPSYQAKIDECNYDYGLQMAKAGFFVICPDLRGFGERTSIPPLVDDGDRDPCDVYFNVGALFGRYSLMLNIWDIKCTIDYLETRPEVDASRIGMMGLSYGGTMTTFTTAVEPRIKAADIICYVTPFQEFAVRHTNFCGSQFVPEIYNFFDTHDVAGLIAPRPLLVEMGIFDKCFYFKDTIRGYEQIQKIYAAAGASDRLHKDIFPGGHAFGGNVAFDFFRKYL